MRARDPWRIPFFYFLFGVGWIVLSSALLYTLVRDPQARAAIEGFKGIGFILISTLVLRIFIGRQLTAWREPPDGARSNQAIFARILELSEIPTCITALANGTYLEVNESFAATLGYRREELLGKSSLRIGTHVEPARRQEIVKMLLDGQAVNNELLVFRTKAGEHRRGHAACETLQYNGQLCILTVFHDADGAPDELILHSNEQYRTIFETNPLPMWVYDRVSLRFLDVNAAAVEHYGYTREEFLALTIDAVRPPETVPPLKQYVMQLEAGGERQYNMRLWQHIKKDGTVIDVEIISHNIDFRGQKARLVLVFDVTDRMRELRALKTADSLL